MDGELAFLEEPNSDMFRQRDSIATITCAPTKRGQDMPG